LWAVGGVLDPSTQTSGSLIEHWNGHVWARFPTPNLGGSTDGALYGCVALSPSDAWAVGASTQLLHWNGSSWQLVPPPGGDLGYLRAITRTPSSPRLWTAGVSTIPTSAQWTPGTGWQQVATDTTQIGLGEGGGFRGVAALSDTEVWAVGNWVPTEGGILDPVIEHWDGLAWHYLPFRQDNTSGLSAVARIPGTNTLWAVGSDNGRALVARGP